MANSEPRPWRHKVSGEIKWQGDDFVSREHWECVGKNEITGEWYALTPETPTLDEQQDVDASAEHLKWWNTLRPDEKEAFLDTIEAEQTARLKAVEAHTPIKGYRQLSAVELMFTNKVKAHAEMTRELIEELKYASSEQDGPNEDFEMDMRWAAIATTNLQQGYMALVRSITRPETF